MVQTRIIASLRIHTEKALERLRKLHIFHRVLPPSFVDAEQMAFVCAVLSKFHPPSVQIIIYYSISCPRLPNVLYYLHDIIWEAYIHPPQNFQVDSRSVLPVPVNTLYSVHVCIFPYISCHGVIIQCVWNCKSVD